jgi:hypothetical protein
MIDARALSNRLAAGFGLLLAVVALAMQLAAGSFAMPRVVLTDFAQALAASICHADAGGSDQGDGSAPHHTPDCVVCPLCQAMAQAHVLLAPMAVVVAVPVLVLVRMVLRRASHVRPGRIVTIATARGPPATL